MTIKTSLSDKWVVSKGESFYYLVSLFVRSFPLRILALSLSLLVTVLCLSAVSSASGQSQGSGGNERGTSQSSDVRSTETTQSIEKTEEPSIWIYLVGGGKLQVDEARETRDGIWYKRGGLTTLLDSKRVVRIEKSSSTQSAPKTVAPPDSAWTISGWGRVQNFFVTKFGRPLPISTFGQSALHDRWGLDHRQGIDVGLHPDSGEGAALIQFLRSQGIPFLAFRGPIPRVSTGPHIHIGRASHRYLPRY